MRYFIFIILLSAGLSANILELGLVNVSNSAVIIPDEAKLTSYIKELGDDNLTKNYIQSMQAIDYFDNSYEKQFPIKTYEDAFKFLGMFYGFIFDENSTQYYKTQDQELKNQQNKILNFLLDAKRGSHQDASIILALTKYCNLQNSIALHNIKVSQINIVLNNAISQLLRGELEFKYSENKLLEEITILDKQILYTKNETLKTTYINEKSRLQYDLQFIKTVEKLQEINKNNSWYASEIVNFDIPNNIATVGVVSNKYQNIYDGNLSLLLKVKQDALTNNKIATILYNELDDSILGISSLFGFEYKRTYWYLRDLYYQIIDYQLFTIENRSILVYDLVIFIFILIAAFILQYILVFIIQKWYNFGVGQLSILLIRASFVFYVIFNFLTQVLGLNSMNITIFASAFSVALGFGMQSLLQNFIAGIIIIGDKTINIGDTISLVGEQSGEVISISYRTTSIRTPNNTIILIPNAKILSEAVENKTKDDPRVLINTTIFVEKQINMQDAEKAVIDSLHKINGFVLGDKVTFGISELKENGFYLEVKFFVEEARYADVSSINKILHYEFKRRLNLD